MPWCVNAKLHLAKACTMLWQSLVTSLDLILCFVLFFLCPEDLHDKMPYNITVTPLLDDRKTGYSTEALQICSRVGGTPNSHFFKCFFEKHLFSPTFYQTDFNNVIFIAPGEVTIRDFQPYDKSAFVSWDTESQDPCSGEVTHYIIFYETQTAKQRQLSKFTRGW